MTVNKSQTVLHALYLLFSHVILIKAIPYYPYVTDEETEAQYYVCWFGLLHNSR